MKNLLVAACLLGAVLITGSARGQGPAKAKVDAAIAARFLDAHPEFRRDFTQDDMGTLYCTNQEVLGNYQRFAEPAKASSTIAHGQPVRKASRTSAQPVTDTAAQINELEKRIAELDALIRTAPDGGRQYKSESEQVRARLASLKSTSAAPTR